MNDNDLLQTMTTIIDIYNKSIGADMGFTDDLRFGKEAEEDMLGLIRTKYPLAFMVEGKHKAYDIFVPEISAGIEVKCDKQAEQTRNMFIEIECNHEYSGILATTSEWYVYRTTKKVFWTKTSAIKTYLISEAQNLKMFRNTPRGETSSVRGYLIPYEDFETISDKYVHLDLITLSSQRKETS